MIYRKWCKCTSKELIQLFLDEKVVVLHMIECLTETIKNNLFGEFIKRVYLDPVGLVTSHCELM